MKERLTNNLGLKILSVVIAVFMWLIMVNVSNPLVSDSQEVTVDMINAEVLEKSNLTYEIIGKKTVTISYEVRIRDRYKISASDFYVYADLAEMYDVTGSVPVKIEVNDRNVKAMIEGTPIAKPGVVRVETEPLQKKRFYLTVNTIGQEEEGYVTGDVALNPEYVYVTGAESVIGQISSVGVELNVEGANSDMEGTTPVYFYDANGNKVLSISNGYINGCRIVDGTDFAGGYPGLGVFIIQEAQGRKAIHLEWLGFDEHKTLIMNKKDQLTNKLQKEHYESVHGVYLGMTRQQVIDLLGIPNFIDKIYGREILKYTDLGFQIRTEYNMVTEITLTGKGAHLDKSGLGIDSSMVDYYNFYQFNRMPSELSKDKYQGPFSIGHGEYIFFDGNEVSLTVYSN